MEVEITMEATEVVDHQVEEDKSNNQITPKYFKEY